VALLGSLDITARHGEWFSDTWIHSATVAEVARHPLHPLEPLTGERVSFPYFSPWAMVLGWLMRLTGCSVFTVLTVAGLCSTGVLLVTWRRLVRALTDARWAPPVCLLCLLLLWGTGTWFWSGFLSLGTFSVGFTWPSVFAAALWFEVWATALRLPQVSRRHRIGSFLVLPGLILLVHPFTAVIAAASVVATLLGRWRVDRRSVVEVVVLAGASGLLALLWPWTSLRILLSNPVGFDAIHHTLYQWHSVVQYAALLVVTLPALVVRLVSNRIDPLACTALVSGVGVAVGGLIHLWSLGRLVPGIAIPGQLALGVLLVETWGCRRSLVGLRRAAVGGLAAVSCVALVVGADANAWWAARAVPGAERRASAEHALHSVRVYPSIRWIRAHVRPGQVAITNNWEALRELPTYGLRTVAPPWPSPGVTDAAQREVAQHAMLKGKTSRVERRDLLATYRVRWVVWVPTETTPQWPFRGARLVACGPDGMSLLKVDLHVVKRPASCGR
jgi:alpha-1,6-mannosyltransferase